MPEGLPHGTERISHDPVQRRRRQGEPRGVQFPTGLDLPTFGGKGKQEESGDVIEQRHLRISAQFGPELPVALVTAVQLEEEASLRASVGDEADSVGLDSDSPAAASAMLADPLDEVGFTARSTGPRQPGEEAVGGDQVLPGLAPRDAYGVFLFPPEGLQVGVQSDRHQKRTGLVEDKVVGSGPVPEGRLKMPDESEVIQDVKATPSDVIRGEVELHDLLCRKNPMLVKIEKDLDISLLDAVDYR